MKIDNRIFIPFAMPFVMLAFARALFFLAGAPWVEPAVTATAFLCLCIGGGAGALIAWGMFENKYTIGFIRIGGKKDGCH